MNRARSMSILVEKYRIKNAVFDKSGDIKKLEPVIVLKHAASRIQKIQCKKATDA